MKKIQIEIKTPEEMIELGRKVGRLCYPNIVLAMNGNLGAGKTTMTKGIGEVLNIKRVINSPTFTIMKVYEGKLTLYHMDVYRITDCFSDFELEEYFEADGVCVVEWAENVSPLLPDSKIDITIKDLGDDKREFIIEAKDNDEINVEIIKKIKESWQLC